MRFLKNCPYCNEQNNIQTEDWERVLCTNCGGIYYVEVHSELAVRKIENNGKGYDHTTEG